MLCGNTVCAIILFATVVALAICVCKQPSTSNEQYVASYPAAVAIDPAVVRAWKQTPIYEGYQVYPAGGIRLYGSSNPNLNPNADLLMAQKYGTLGAINRLSVGQTVYKDMNV